METEGGIISDIAEGRQIEVSDSCWKVVVSYGAYGLPSSTVTSSTKTNCYTPPCVINSPVVECHKDSIASDGSVVSWACNG
jgi:hypothetical protein